jgi:hypothetical protein
MAINAQKQLFEIFVFLSKIFPQKLQFVQFNYIIC